MSTKTEAAAKKARPDKGSKKGSEKKDPKKELIEWLESLGMAVVIAVILTQFIFINAVIPTGSMNDTIKTRDRLVGFRFAYWFKEPQRGDVVIFRTKSTSENKLLIKRIIGLPGETVEIRESKVFVDGTEIKEDYLKDKIIYGDYGPYVLEDDQYFVMGDNRNNSLDARYWDKNYILKKEIIGRAVWIYWRTPRRIERVSY